MKPGLLILTAALGLASPALALAQTAATPLQAQMAGEMLQFIDFRAQVQQGMESSTLPPPLLAARPEWPAMLKAAIGEEVDRDMPTIDSIVGQALGRTFTDDEVKIGVKILADANLRVIYQAAQSGGRPPDVQIAKATEDALATPAGQSFASKLQVINDSMQPVLVDVTATLAPGVLRRFGEKAEAAEIAHRAAAGYAAAK